MASASGESENLDEGDTIDRAVQQFIERQQAGEMIDLEQFCRPYGARAAELRILLEEFLGIESALRAPQRAEETVQVSGASWDDPNWGRYVSQLRSRGPAYQRYSFLGEIGRGGMGVVLRVFDNDTRRVLAMKVIKGRGIGPFKGTTPVVDSKRLGRFLEEAQVTAQLDHPSIVPVHEVGVDGEGNVYFTMKYVRGKTLREVLDERTTDPSEWPWTRIIGILAQVCDAVDFAHDKGVIHRDLKPENLMIGDYGETYVMDWGLARLHDGPVESSNPSERTSEMVRTHGTGDSTTRGSPGFTHSDEVMGTPHYMSPEQADARQADVGKWSDIYSVGAILYRMLSGLRPYESTSSDHRAFSVVRQVVAGPPKAIAEIDPNAPPDLVAICEKAMARSPSERYSSMKAMATDLRAWLDGRAVSVYRGGLWFVLRKWATRNPAAAALSSLLLVTVPFVPTLYILNQETRSISDKKELLSQIELAKKDTEIAEREREIAEARNNDLLREKENQDKAQTEQQEREARERDLREKRKMLIQANEQIGKLSEPIGESAWDFGVAAGLDDWLRKVEEASHCRSTWDAWLADLKREAVADSAAEELHDLIRNTIATHDRFFAERGTKSFVAAIATRRDRLRAIEQACEGETVRRCGEAQTRLAADPRFANCSFDQPFGLVPLGPDPKSGLEEFAHLATGIPPRRYASGQLEVGPESAYVLVLLPPGEVVIGSQSVDPSDVNFDPAAKPEESALERVRCGPLMVGKSECTRAQWNRLLGNEVAIESPASSSAMAGVRLSDVLNTGEQFGLLIPSMKQWEYGVRLIERIAAGQPVLQGLRSTWEWCAEPGEINATEAWAMGGANRDGAARASARLWFDARALEVEFASGGSVGFRFVMQVTKQAPKTRG